MFGIGSILYLNVHLFRLFWIFLSFPPNGLPPGEYISPLYTMQVDTLISSNTILRFAPDWDGERLGVDVRYLLDSGRTRQSTFLVGSYLLVFSDRDSIPVICHLEGKPAYFSISRSGLFALVYQQINTSDSARFLNLVDLRTGNIVNFKVAEGANFLQCDPFGVLVTDDGKIAVPRPLNAPHQVYVFEDNSWKEIDTGSDYLTAKFSSQAGNRLLQCFRDQVGLILTTDLDILACFDPGRAYMNVILGNSGNTVLYSSTIGISAYYVESGGVTGDLFDYSGTQAPVVSASDSYWSCTFRHNSNRLTGDCIVISGKVEDVGDFDILYFSEAEIKTLAVSDNGDVLCTQALTDPRLHMAYRYLIVNSSGRVVWASEINSPFFFNPRPSGNSAVSIAEIRPRLADISGNGNRLLLWNNGQVIEYSFSVRDFFYEIFGYTKKTLMDAIKSS